MSCQKSWKGEVGGGFECFYITTQPKTYYISKSPVAEVAEIWLLIPGMAPTNFNEQFVDLCKARIPKDGYARWFYSHNKLLIFKIKYLTQPQTFLSWNRNTCMSNSGWVRPKVKYKLYVLWSTDLWYISAKINANYFLLIFGVLLSCVSFGKILSTVIPTKKHSTNIFVRKESIKLRLLWVLQNSPNAKSFQISH